MFQNLKERIHAFRVPLGPRGRFVMGVIYFCTPVLGGYMLLNMIEDRPMHRMSRELPVEDSESVNIARDIIRKSLK